MAEEQQIALYSAAMCGDCQRLKEWMDEEGIAYENRDIRDEPAHAQELEQRTGKLGVPYLVINGEWKRAYDPGKEFDPEFARGLFQ